MAANAFFRGGWWRNRAGRFIGQREARRRIRISDSLVSRRQREQAAALFPFTASERFPEGEGELIDDPFLREVASGVLDRLFLTQGVEDRLNQVPDKSVRGTLRVTMTILESAALPARMPLFDIPITFTVVSDVAQGATALFTQFVFGWSDGFREQFMRLLYEILGLAEQAVTREEMTFSLDNITLEVEAL